MKKIVIFFTQVQPSYDTCSGCDQITLVVLLNKRTQELTCSQCSIDVLTYIANNCYNTEVDTLKLSPATLASIVERIAA